MLVALLLQHGRVGTPGESGSRDPGAFWSTARAVALRAPEHLRPHSDPAQNVDRPHTYYGRSFADRSSTRPSAYDGSRVCRGPHRSRPSRRDPQPKLPVLARPQGFVVASRPFKNRARCGYRVVDEVPLKQEPEERMRSRNDLRRPLIAHRRPTANPPGHVIQDPRIGVGETRAGVSSSAAPITSKYSGSQRSSASRVLT